MLDRDGDEKNVLCVYIYINVYEGDFIFLAESSSTFFSFKQNRAL